MKKQRQKRESKNQIAKRERQSRVRNLMVQLGIWNKVKNAQLKDYLLQAYYPPIEVSVSEDISTNEQVCTMQDEICEAISTATFDCPLLGQDFSVVDYFLYVKPLGERLRTIKLETAASEVRRQFEQAIYLANEETTHNAYMGMCDGFVGVLWAHTRIDGFLYFVQYKRSWTENNRLQQQLTLNRVQPEQRRVGNDADLRTAYRCGYDILDGVKWIEWPSSALGLKFGQTVYPVFVQRHVFERLYGRDGRIFCGKEFEARLQNSLTLSLIDPRIHPQDDNTYLVEYHLDDYKVGYVVAERLDDVILLKTFLFLTMDGTPEGTKLWKQLRLDRSGKEYTGLDRLPTFMDTDLASIRA